MSDHCYHSPGHCLLAAAVDRVKSHCFLFFFLSLHSANTTGQGNERQTYGYVYDPRGVDCNDEGRTAVCQYADFPRNCGKPDQVCAVHVCVCLSVCLSVCE